MFTAGSHGGTNSNSQSRSSSSTFENKFNSLTNKGSKYVVCLLVCFELAYSIPPSTFHDSLNAGNPNFRRDERKTSDITNYYQGSKNGSLPGSRNSSTTQSDLDYKTHIDISPSDFSEKVKDCLNKYFDDNSGEKALKTLKSFCSLKNFDNFVLEFLQSAVEKKTEKRHEAGELFGYIACTSKYDLQLVDQG